MGFLDPYIPVEKQNLWSCPYTGRYGSEKTRILEYFTQWKFNVTKYLWKTRFEQKHWCVAAFLWLPWLLPLLTDKSFVLSFYQHAAIFQHSRENGWKTFIPRPHPVSSKLWNISISETVYALLGCCRENSPTVSTVGPGMFFNLKKL